MPRWARVCIAIVGVLVAVAVAYGQTSDLERRIDRLEDMRPDARLTAIETRLNTLEDVGKGILIALGVQILLSGLSLKAGTGKKGG
jgi:hypothetical protein